MTLILSCWARSTIDLRFLEETPCAISAQYFLFCIIRISSSRTLWTRTCEKFNKIRIETLSSGYYDNLYYENLNNVCRGYLISCLPGISSMKLLRSKIYLGISNTVGCRWPLQHCVWPFSLIGEAGLWFTAEEKSIWWPSPKFINPNNLPIITGNRKTFSTVDCC